MDGNVDRILDSEEIKDAIDEMCEDVKDFGKVRFVHLMWGTSDGKKGSGIQVKQRFYGSEDMLIAELDKAKFAFLKEAMCGGEDD
jgi:hypothetical protein